MALTKVTGGTISTTSNYEVGVITATKFVGPFEGSVTGVATGSSKVITSDESSDTTCFPLFVNSSTDAYQAPKLGSNLTFNSSTGDLGATKVTAEQFVGNISGTGATFTTLEVSGTLNYTHVTDVYSVGVATFANNVQIGAGISVVGVSTFSGDLYVKNTYPRIYLLDTDSNSDFSLINDNGTFSIYDDSNSAHRLRIEPGGDVGIGTTNPHKKLHVVKYGGHGAVRIEASGDTNRSGIEFYRETSAGIGKGGAAIWVESDTSSTNGKLRFGTASNASVQSQGTDMILDNNGRLGIGTDDPQRNVHIHQPTAASSYLHMTNSTTGAATTDGFSLYVATDGQTYYRARESTGTHIFYTGTTEALRIRNDRNVSIASSLAVTGVTTSSDYDLSAIDKSISDTAVDVFVYDTRKDSDGGAWRKRTSHTSWYNETLGSSTRGSRKEFPAVAVIVAESTKIKIYDGDDPEMPMWMVFNQGSSAGENRILNRFMGDIKAISMLNGNLFVCANSTSSADRGGGVWINFISEISYAFGSSDAQSENIFGFLAHTISQRNTVLGTNVYGDKDSKYQLVDNSQCNYVAMTVLPNAPIDDYTGLPIPTIAVATDSGLSVIKDNGKVCDMFPTGSSVLPVNQIYFTKSNNLAFTHNAYWINYYPIPDRDTSSTYWNGLSNFIGRFTDTERDWATNGIPINVGANGIANFLEDRAIGHTNGVDIIDINEGGLLGSGMHCGIATDFNTGWQHGNIKGAWLASTDDTNISADTLGSGNTFDGTFATSNGWTANSDWTIGSNVATCDGTNSGRFIYPSTDRWDIGTSVVVEVTVTRTAGTLYVSYSTGGATSGTDMATSGTYYHVGEVTGNTLVYFRSESFEGTIDNVKIYPAEADRSVSNTGLVVVGTVTKDVVATGADLVYYTGIDQPNGNYLYQPYNADLNFGTGDFSCIFWGYVSSTGGNGDSYLISRRAASTEGFFVFYHYGTPYLRFRTSESSSYATLDISNPNILDRWVCFAFVRRNGQQFIYLDGKERGNTASTKNVNSTAKLTIGWTEPFPATARTSNRFSLVRVSASAPSEEQIKKIYEDEKKLFAPNSKCTLYGSSDAVTGLAYDDSDNTIHVGTSSGRSQIQGLNRINNTTTAVTTAISASN